MTPFFDNIAIEFIRVVLYLLALLFVILFFVVLIRRYLLQYREQRIQESEARITPLLYMFLDGEAGIEEISDNLNNIYDIVVTFRGAREMIDNLEGEQKQRLQELLGLPHFRNYFTKKIYSSNVMDIAQACMYFEKNNITENRIVKRLLELQKHEFSVIAYSSTLALINTREQEIRDSALSYFLRRKNNASMAVNDIVFKYFTNHQDKQKAAGILFEHIADSSVPVKNSAPIVRMLPELDLYHLADDLFRLLKSPLELEHDHTGELRAAIIEVFNRISPTNLTPVLIEQRTAGSDFQCIRLATARWMKQHYNRELDPVLYKLARDTDLEVRIEAQSALIQSPDMTALKERLEPKYQQEWNDIIDAGGEYVGLD